MSSVPTSPRTSTVITLVVPTDAQTPLAGGFTVSSGDYGDSREATLPASALPPVGVVWTLQVPMPFTSAEIDAHRDLIVISSTDRTIAAAANRTMTDDSTRTYTVNQNYGH